VALESALKAVPNIRVYTSPGAVVDPPGVLVGPPALTWEAFSSDPTQATFVVYAITRADDRALERLWDLVPLVAAAVDTVPDAATTQANPSAFNDLPCYEITVEVSLT
jgi:hypothetical protein